jgi:phosphatidylglycerol---prolipoprotein diacylglyceryl transferase
VNVHPVLTVLDLGPEPRALGSYGACLAAAVVITAWLSLRAVTRRHPDPGAAIASLAAGIGAGFAGAYLTFTVLALVRGASLAHALSHPGLVFYGGAVGALAGFAWTAQRLALPVGPSLDALAPVLPLGHALGRVGCFLGGCCFGAETHVPWAVTYTDALAPAAALAVPRHPWPLYEAAASLLLSVVLWRTPVTPRAGTRFVLYVAAYGGMRVVLEPLRGDALRGVYLGGHVSTSQLLALATTLAALAFVVRVRAAVVAGTVAALAFLLPLAGHAQRNERLAVQLPARLRVVAGAFSIDRTEVSWGAYRKCAAQGACLALEAKGAAPDDLVDAMPVAYVTQSEAARYCNSVGGRLPKDNEWERAARGGSARIFPWGSIWNPKLVNHGAEAGGPDAADGHAGAAPVDSFPDGRSLHGAVHMAGNVWEWVQAPGVARGGSFSSPHSALRVAHRELLAPDLRRADVGFRCVYDVR